MRNNDSSIYVSYTKNRTGKWRHHDVIFLFSLLAFELKENQNDQNIGLLKIKLLAESILF